MKVLEGDFRDRLAVTAWAEEIADSLRSEKIGIER